MCGASRTGSRWASTSCSDVSLAFVLAEAHTYVGSFDEIRFVLLDEGLRRIVADAAEAFV